MTAKIETWLILGASGGIGRAVTNAVIEDGHASRRLIGTTRHETNGPAAPEHNVVVRWHGLDYTQPSSIEALTTWCNTALDQIDRIVCATGVLSSTTLQPEKNMSALSLTSLQKLMQVNAYGPLLFLAGIQPLLRRSHIPKIAVLSAQVGSIEDNRMGGWYSYRMSKAALNMGVKSLAIESARWRNPPIIAAVHPGTTLTELSRPFTKKRSDIRSASETGEALFHFTDTLTPAQNGGFFRLDGIPLPW